MSKSLYLVVFLACSLSITWGQDIHFTQYNFAPMNVNPAFAGLMEGNHRINIKHRNQWTSVLRENSYKSIAASYDFKICNGGNPFGFSLSLLGDQSGELAYSNVQANLGISYHQKLETGNYLVAGIQAGINQYRFTDDNLRFDEQFDGFDFDPTLPNFEEFDQLSTRIMLDLNFGVL